MSALGVGVILILILTLMLIRAATKAEWETEW